MKALLKYVAIISLIAIIGFQQFKINTMSEMQDIIASDMQLDMRHIRRDLRDIKQSQMLIEDRSYWENITPSASGLARHRNTTGKFY